VEAKSLKLLSKKSLSKLSKEAALKETFHQPVLLKIDYVFLGVFCVCENLS